MLRKLQKVKKPVMKGKQSRPAGDGEKGYEEMAEWKERILPLEFQMLD